MDNVESKPEKKKEVNKLNVAILAILVIIAGFMFLGGDVEELTEYFNPPEPKTSASVEMLRFTDMSSNSTLTVELWIVNTGEETASELHVFVRAYNQNGTILHSDNVSMLAMILRGEETTSGLYILPITSSDSQIYHTIEITWNGGRNIYSETTLL